MTLYQKIKLNIWVLIITLLIVGYFCCYISVEYGLLGDIDPNVVYPPLMVFIVLIAAVLLMVISGFLTAYGVIKFLIVEHVEPLKTYFTIEEVTYFFSSEYPIRYTTKRCYNGQMFTEKISSLEKAKKERDSFIDYEKKLTIKRESEKKVKHKVIE